MPKRAGLYIRVSKEEQALNGYSLDAQENKLIEYAKSKGYTIIDIFRDKGITARKKPSRRLEFMRMIKAVENNELDIILFIKLDRWFRNVSDYYQYQAILDKHNVEWEATEEDYNTSTAQGRLYLNIKLSIAQNESDITSERIKFVFADKLKRKEVLSGQTRLGYKIVDKHIVKNEDAPIVADIFNTYIDTHSVRKTMMIINDKYNIQLKYGRIYETLRDEKYTGLYKGIENFTEPIITHEIYDKVTFILKEQSFKMPRSNNHIYIFGKLIKCPLCGSTLYGNANKRHKNLLYYYRCRNYLMNKTCSFVSIREDKIEESLLLKLKPLIQSLILTSAEEQEKIKKPSINVSSLKDKIKRLKELYVDGMIDRDEYNADYFKFQKLLTEAKAPIPKINLKPLEELLSVNIEDMYSKLDRAHKKLFWHSICKEININHDKEIVDIIFLDKFV